MPTDIEWLERINPVDRTTLKRLGEGAMATSLFNEIVRPQPFSLSAHRARHRNTWVALVAVVAACLVAACVVLATGALGSKPASAVMFKQQGRAVIVTIVNQMATAGDLSQAFAEHHLDISVRLIPVSPSEVGKVITQEGPGGATIRPLPTPGCVIGDPVCPITLSISHIHGHSSVEVGRGALPGDRYASSASVFGPGEVLHCSGLINASVAEASSYLSAHHLAIEWEADPPSAAGTGESTTTTTRPSPFPNGVPEFVIDGQAVSSTEVMLFVSRTPASAAVVQERQGDC